MGLLDDAIREHLDLKRRRGADPAEIERAENDALGPVRRDPVGSDEVNIEHAALPDDDLAYEEEAAYEHELEAPHDLEEPPQFDGPEAAAPPPELEYTLDQETEVWDELEPDAPGLVDHSHGAHAPHPADSPPVEQESPRSMEPPSSVEPHEEEPLAKAPPEPYAAPAPPAAQPREPQPVEPHEPEPTSPDPHPTSPHGDPLGSDTAEYDLELEEVEGEDVLEETPEFLQDTPDHDRLWFEQRPPKDFDFDD